MGKVYSVLWRTLNNYNIENRAHKVISLAKPKPAPKHKSTEKELEWLIKENPQAMQEQLKKNEMLDQNLKSVYVTSFDPDSSFEQRTNDPNKPLPLDRKIVENFEFGYKEPENVTVGKCTLRQAITFLVDHQKDPEIYTSSKIALQYNLPKETVDNILQYFSVYNVYLPGKSKLVTAGGKDSIKIESGKSNDDATKK